ncbi:MAG: hypothetical protein ACE5LU_02380 [Anaerolineae bacterium]
MSCLSRSTNRLSIWAGLSLVAGLLGLLLVACGGQIPQASLEATAPVGEVAAAAPTDTPVPLILLKTDPEVGPVGTAFTVTGNGFPPGKPVEFVWGTVDGTYHTELNNNRQEFYERQFTPTRVSLGRATADASGKVTATFTAPEDYGEIHDIYAVVDGEDVAKGGFRISRSVTISPQKGPVGTPITVTIKGLGWKAFVSTVALRYDNKYTGFLSATTTRGTAVAQIRAAGPVGKHVIEIDGASHTLPYLNVQQSPVAYIGDFQFDFTVTENPAAPPPTLDWSDNDPLAVGDSVPRTTILGLGSASGVSASLSSSQGPIHSKSVLIAEGLPPEAPVDILWMTVSGNDLFGWNLAEQPLAKETVGKDGSLSTTIEVPHSLGGWHAIRLVRGETVLAELPYFVERSLVHVTPRQVKVGEPFQVQIKGVGWTELDNGVAVTYDNAYIGYACGFASQGDVTLNLVATGEPGVHLIDLYPMIYDGGHGKWPWQYTMPHLTALQDHPALALGYKLPIFRLAIEIVE